MFISSSFKDNILSLILPFSVFFMYKPPNKLICSTVYILSHLILPFFIEYDYYYYNFIIIISAALFLFVPNIKKRSNLLTDEYKNITGRNKLIQRVNTFASLFRQLTNIFQEFNRDVNIGEFVGYVYEDVCLHCPSRDLCFYQDGGISRLGKLINKGFKYNFNNEDNECPSQATRLPRNFLLEKEKGDLLPLPSKEIRSKYHLKLNEVYVTNESLFQYKYNKYSLPQEYIGKRVGLAVQNKEVLIYYNGKIIEKHPITNNKFNIKEEHELYYKKTDKQAFKESNQIILKELENIIYDND